MLKSRNLKYFLIISNQFEEGKPSQSRSVELSFNNKQPSRIISPLTDSTVYSMSDINSSVSTTMKINQKKKKYMMKYLFHLDFIVHQTSLLKSKSIQHENILKTLKEFTY